MIGHFTVMVIFTIAAIYLLQGKGAWMVAGYNMFSKSEKAKYNEAVLCKFVGKLMVVTVFALSLFLLSEIFQIVLLSVIGGVLVIAISIFGITYMHTKNRFKKDDIS